MESFIGLIYWCPVTHRRKEVALRSVHVDARVVDLCASVQLTQRYVNSTSSSVEAVYVFPIDNRAAVSGFEVEIDGVVTKADVQAKAEARQTYERAIAAGDSAQLLEKVRDDVFQMSVGNLKPWTTAVIRVTYVADVAIEGDGVLFFLPTFVAPRYTPIGAEHVASGDGKAAPDGLRLDLVAAMSSDIVSMESQTAGLDIATSEQPGNGRIRTATLRNAVMSLNKDLIIKIVTKEPHAPRCLVEHDPEADTYSGVVTLAPHIDFDDKPCELVFLVDRSGSMSGYNIEQAKKALQLFFRSLPEDCYINIMGFGSRFETLWPTSTKYGAKSLEKASRHITTLNANLGGTELANPLQALLAQAPIPGYARQVFVLTDGQVSNTSETIAVVQRAVRTNPTTRVFALGLGNGASHDLVEGIAEAGHGTAAFCVNQDNLREKVVTQLSRAIQPALTDVVIEWEGAVGAPPNYHGDEPTEEPPAAASGGHGLLDAFAPAASGSLLGFSSRTTAPANPANVEGFARAPFNPPPIHTGSRFLSYCLVAKGGKPPVAVRVTAKSPAGPLDVRLAVTPADIVKGTLLHTMAARSLIHDLEKNKSWMHQDGPRSADPAAVKAEIIRLGTTYSLASMHTSFVAVQKNVGRSVDNILERGESLDSLSCQSDLLQCSAISFQASSSSLKKKKGGGMLGAVFGGMQRPAARMAAPPMSRSRAQAPPPPSAPDGGGGERGGGGGGRGGGRGGSAMRMCAAPQMAAMSQPQPVAMEECMDDCGMDSDEEDDGEYCSMMMDAKDSFCAPSAEPIKSKAKPALAPDALLEEIIKHQEFSGAFDLTASLMAMVGCDLAEAKAAAQRLKISERLVATALVITFFRDKLAALRTEWTLIEAKAVKFLKKALIPSAVESSAVLQEASQLITAV